MKKVLLISSLFLLGSCKYSGEPQGEVIKQSGYTIKVIDSCEYIEVDMGYIDSRTYSLTHKGNCKFCAKTEE